MYRLSIRTLLLSLIVTVTSASAGSVPSLESLESANRALQGQRVTVELQTGTVVTGAREVVMGSELTRWTRDGERAEVATSGIRRVVIEKRSRIKRWTKRGALAGTLLGAIGFGYSEMDGPFVGSGGVEGAAAGAIAGAAVGAAGGALSGKRVVFEAADWVPPEPSS